MAYVNDATGSLAVKIVYYGPGLSGKTTNLRYIYFKLDPVYRGELICFETESDRTYFFDLLPIKAGLVGRYKVHFHLMTVPGQVFYEASRKSVLKGADGIIFVADSQSSLFDANLESFDGLRRNCLEQGIDLNDIPMVFQYNKRDLPNLIPVETLNNLLNPRRQPFFEASALNGVGVFESLKAIARASLPLIRERTLEGEQDAITKKDADTGLLEPEPSEDRKPAKKKGEDIEFVPPKKAQPFDLKKIKIKSQKQIEDELEKLSREFTTRKK